MYPLAWSDNVIPILVVPFVFRFLVVVHFIYVVVRVDQLYTEFKHWRVFSVPRAACRPRAVGLSPRGATRMRRVWLHADDDQLITSYSLSSVSFIGSGADPSAASSGLIVVSTHVLGSARLSPMSQEFAPVRRHSKA